MFIELQGCDFEARAQVFFKKPEATGRTFLLFVAAGT